jgi:transcriptional regulator GlxA family with amidase domain
MLIAIYVYDGMTALDAIGPYDILNRIPATQVALVGDGAGLKSSMGGAGVAAQFDLDDVAAPEVLVVPGGGPALAEQTRNQRLLAWIRTVDASSTWTVSVCTGALILGAAGLLAQRRATTHWRARESLARFGAEYVDERWVRDGKLITAAGVSAGIDIALALTELLAGPTVADAVQLSAHYDPRPPRPFMHWSVASPEILHAVEHDLGPR